MTMREDSQEGLSSTSTLSHWANKIGGGGGWLRFLAAFISAKERRTRHSYFQVVGIRLVGRCDVLINQQADVFQGIQPFALQQIHSFC